MANCKFSPIKRKLEAGRVHTLNIETLRLQELRGYEEASAC